MLTRWTKQLLWRPFETFCRKRPIVPLKATITRPVDGVVCIRIDNIVTQLLSRFSGGYDYAVCYLIDETLLVDTGFGWANRALRQTLTKLGADKTIECVVNTHYHEDHTGNNDLLAEMTDAKIVAHRQAIPEIRFPSSVAWYRNFLFGPSKPVNVEPIAERVHTRHFHFDVLDMPGHCPGHICLFEPTMRWLISGDLYIAPDLDSQLADADGPQWIASLDRALALRPSCMFDAHGAIFTDENAISSLLQRKRDFLIKIQQRVLAAAKSPKTIQQVTREVFNRGDLVEYLSLNDGWMSLITGSDFSRGNLIKSFLRESVKLP